MAMPRTAKRHDEVQNTQYGQFYRRERVPSRILPHSRRLPGDDEEHETISRLSRIPGAMQERDACARRHCRFPIIHARHYIYESSFTQYTSALLHTLHFASIYDATLRREFRTLYSRPQLRRIPPASLLDAAIIR